MFIVDQKHRGKGMGRELFKCAMADAEKAGVSTFGPGWCRGASSNLSEKALCRLAARNSKGYDTPQNRQKVVTR